MMIRRDAEDTLSTLLGKPVKFNDDTWDAFKEWVDDEHQHSIEDRMEGDKECGICSFCDQDIKDDYDREEFEKRFLGEA